MAGTKGAMWRVVRGDVRQVTERMIRSCRALYAVVRTLKVIVYLEARKYNCNGFKSKWEFLALIMCYGYRKC